MSTHGPAIIRSRCLINGVATEETCLIEITLAFVTWLLGITFSNLLHLPNVCPIFVFYSL